MKSVLPLFALALLASCTTAYKTGQTPDDVYFSPERPQEEYVRVEQRNDRQYRPYNQYNQYDDDYYNDRYLRMRVRNRQMWSDLDYYYSDPYAYNYNNRYNRFNYYNNIYWNPYASWNYYYNPYSSWNYYHSPYAPNVFVVNPKSPVYNRPRTSNLHVFDSPEMNVNAPKNTTGRNSRVFESGYGDPNYNAPRRNAGSDLRNTFGNNNSSDNSSWGNNAPSRSVDNSGSRNSGSSSSSSSGSSSGSSGGNAPVRKF